MRPRQLIISSNAHVNCHRAAAAFKGGPKVGQTKEMKGPLRLAGREWIIVCLSFRHLAWHPPAAAAQLLF